MSYLDLIKEEVGYAHPNGVWIGAEHSEDPRRKLLASFYPKENFTGLSTIDLLNHVIRRNPCTRNEYRRSAVQLPGQTKLHRDSQNLGEEIAMMRFLVPLRLCILTGALSVCTQEISGTNHDIICVYVAPVAYYFVDTLRGAENLNPQRGVKRCGRSIARIDQDLVFEVPHTTRLTNGFYFSFNTSTKTFSNVQNLEEYYLRLKWLDMPRNDAVVTGYAFSRHIGTIVEY